MSDEQERRILVLGMTYPSYSAKYAENVCTGGLEEGTGRMVRIHPIPHRYLDPRDRFKSFQWIRARVARHPSDPRPESLRVDPGSIVVEEEIPASQADARRRLIEASPHVVRSVEELKDRYESHETSLGAMRPREILGIRIKQKNSTARREWEEKERELLAQTTMSFLRPPKKIDFPEVEFLVKWRCDDPRCNTHEMGMQTWGLHELYRKLGADPEREAKVRAQMGRMLDLAERDVFFFLGNFRSKMFNFGLMDCFSAGRKPQLSLLF